MGVAKVLSTIKGTPWLVCDACELFDVQHIDARIGDGFAEQRFGIRAESLVYFLFGCIGVNEGTLDAQFFSVTPNRLNVPP